ncbi:hypothetical protein IPL85_05350 [Candidatus Saccharibacteria bacterium]|nr:MAG: hypothetical protein IPL85_05350 [Candidatus Saccharibacteria bacterium]
MMIIDGSPVSITECYGGPHITAEENTGYMFDTEVSGSVAWHTLRRAGVLAKDINTLSIHFGGLSDEVKTEIDKNGTLYGITTGSSYDPKERNITVFAGNIWALALPDRLAFIPCRDVTVDRALRLALGRFVHDTHSKHDKEQSPQQIMVGRRAVDSSVLALPPLGPNHREMLEAFHVDLWPALATMPLGYFGGMVVAQLFGEAEYLKTLRQGFSGPVRCAASFERNTRETPIVRYAPTNELTTIFLTI